MKPILAVSVALAAGVAGVASSAQANTSCVCRTYHRAHYVHYRPVTYRHVVYRRVVYPRSYTRVIYEAPYRYGDGGYGYPAYGGGWRYERPYVRVVEPAYGDGWYGRRWHDHGRRRGWYGHHGW